MFFRVCNYCGAALDPGEKCDCREQKQQRDKQISQALRMDPWGADGNEGGCMETSTVTITKEEYEKLVEAKIRLGLLQNYVENETYYSKADICNFLNMPKEEKSDAVDR